MKKRPIEILMAEDNEDEMILMQEALEGLSVQRNVNHVKDGVDALLYLRKLPPYESATKPDILLLDLNMPRKNGMEVLTEIKADKDLKSIPVIILTTSSSPDDIMKSYNNFANCYITKPNSFNDLQEVVDLIEGHWLKIAQLPTKDE